MKRFCALIATFVLILPSTLLGDILKRDDEERKKALCALIVHKPDADVAYKPGVTVDGKPVVPADLNPSPITAPESFSFQITRDLAGLLDTNVAPFEMEAGFGTITARDNGAGGYDLYYNGQPLTPAWVRALQVYCELEENTVDP